MRTPDKARIAPFYLYHIFAHLLPLYAVYTVIVYNTLQSEMLTSVLIALWASVVALLEIPSGILADSWNKKYVLIISQAAKLGSCIIWMMGGSFAVLAVGFVFWGICESFSSGVVEALLFEELDQFDKASDYQRISGLCQFLLTVGIATAFFAGGLLKDRSITLIFHLSLISAVCSILVCFFIPGSLVERTRINTAVFYRSLKHAISQIGHSPQLKRILMFCIIHLTIIGTIEEFMQLWLSEHQLPGIAFGGYLTLVMLSQMIGAGIGSLFIIRKNIESIMYLCMTLCGFLLVSGMCVPRLSMLLMVVVFIITGFLETKFNTVSQENISDQRATILSINSFSMNGTAIVYSVFIGFLSERYSFGTSFGTLGFLVISGGLILLFLSRKNRQRHRDN